MKPEKQTGILAVLLAVFIISAPVFGDSPGGPFAFFLPIIGGLSTGPDTVVTPEGPVVTTGATNPLFVDGQLLVGFKPEKIADKQQKKIVMDRAHAALGAEVAEDLDAQGVVGVQLVSLPPGISVEEATTKYMKNEDVAYAEPNYILSMVEDPPLEAPVNPAFSDFRQAGFPPMVTDEGNSLGYLPSPVPLPPVTGSGGGGTATYPARYDLRNENKVSPVKNQGSCGSCWAHGAYGSLESCLMPSGNWDFSENHLKNLHGFDWSCCDGGNNDISIAYLSRRTGPVTEGQDPYTTSSCTSPTGLSPSLHLDEALMFPPRTGDLDNDVIKTALMTFGGLSASYYHGGTYYNSATASYYCPQTSGHNHIITIIGWDDTYDRNRFRTPPSGNGAWLCKNSWGPGFGQGGYFYVSYYDKTLGYGEIAAFNQAGAASRYSRIYSYDPLGWVSSYGYGSTTAWGANVFPAEASENLAAVSFYTPSSGSSFQVDVYTGVGSSPVSGTLRSRTTGTFPYPGYHTVTLASPVSLTAGQKFSVVLRVTSPGTNYPIAMELPISGYSSKATGSAGQSFMSSSGSSWTDITTWRTNSNICIKAFTTGTNPAPTLTPTSTPTPLPTTPPTAVPTPSPGTRLPNDPSFSALWGLSQANDCDIDAPEAWAETTGSADVVVAVIDTGVEYTHPDLAGNMWVNTDEVPGNGRDDDGNGYVDDYRGFDFANGDPDPMDDNLHGTHCAGTIAAVGNNGIGVTGTAWQARVMPVKFLTSGGSGTSANAALAIAYARNNGAKVISNSWGGTGYSSTIANEIAKTDALFLFAAGNSAVNIDSSPFYPAAMSYSQIVSVAATDQNDNLAYFSNFGPSSVDLGAPGKDIYSTRTGSAYSHLSGTSMATPHVAGAGVLIRAKNPGLSTAEVKSALLNNVDTRSSLSGRVLTGGRLNAYRAVHSVTGPTVDAKFACGPVYGVAPLEVRFTDLSTGNPTSWSWSFGDGGTSIQQHPTHTYSAPGSYTVSLTVSNGAGSDQVVANL